MSMIKIVVCRTQHDANVAMQRMQMLGMNCLPVQQFQDIIWDASAAHPQDSPLAFDDQFVVIGTKP